LILIESIKINECNAEFIVKTVVFLFSKDANILLRRQHEFKNKLREELKAELLAISGAGDTGRPGVSKNPHKIRAITTDNKAGIADTTDYFELVYECINTRPNFLM
jgi:hypothetical protein